jgi:predicted nucleotidyltransferase
MHKDLAKAAKLMGIELPALEEASKASQKLLSDYKKLLYEKLSKDLPEAFEETDVVLFGSIAREEGSSRSDCDYYVLQKGAPPSTTRKLIMAMEEMLVDLEIRRPGAQRVFGEIVVAANLYESIGLELDSNANMTRRILLLSESKPITKGITHEIVFDNILSRYCADYTPPDRPEMSPAKVPRYLLNDLVRYWRTMAVDFGTKRWRDGDSSLRLAKLRITRKILFAGPLATVLLAGQKIETNNQLQNYLKESLVASPLAQIARHIDLLDDDSKEAAGILLQNYDKFIGILSGEKRDLLEKVKGTPASRDLKRQCRAIGDKIQSSLEKIFFEDPLFKESFRKYSVF